MKAVEKVGLELAKGNLLGAYREGVENGAGKSTLMNVLGGVITPE